RRRRPLLWRACAARMACAVARRSVQSSTACGRESRLTRDDGTIGRHTFEVRSTERFRAGQGNARSVVLFPLPLRAQTPRGTVGPRRSASCAHTRLTAGIALALLSASCRPRLGWTLHPAYAGERQIGVQLFFRLLS